MSLPRQAVEKKVTVVMVTAGLILLGIISFKRLPQELFPPIVFPQVTIITEYANAAPEEIESLITKPIEESIGAVAGLKRIESISREGRSTVTAAFNWGQDIDFAALAVREKIDLVKERLPKESGDPMVLKFDPLARPVLMLSITAPGMPPIQLKHLTEKIFKDNLEKIEGVASVSISGGLDREILVEIDQARLQANHLSLLEVIDSIEHSNVTYPAGSIKKGLYEYLIRTVGEFRSVKEIEYAVAGVDMVEKMKGHQVTILEKGSRGPRRSVDALREEVEKKMMEKRLVLMRDIAQVVDGTAEKTSISRFNGRENISVSIQKQANGNTIQVVDRLKKALAFLEEDIAARGMEYDIIYDHSVFIRESLTNLLEEAKSGGMLSFLALLFFLRAFGPAFVVTLSVPLSVLGTFILMGASGITLNTMSIGGLVLAIGMISDTSIVVLENIFRRREQGESPEEGAIHGTEEVMWPVVASNLTTVAVFFPLIVFVPGIPGQIFKDLSWTIIDSQIISTILPITLVTMLSVYFKVKSTEYKPLGWTKPLEKLLIGTSFSQRMGVCALIIMIAFGICSSSLLIFAKLDKEVLPKVDQGQFLIRINMPLGTRLEVTDKLSNKIEEVIREGLDVKDIAVTIGAEKSEKGQVQIDTLRPSQAVILVTLNEERKRSSAEILHELQQKMGKVNLRDAQVEFVLQESEFSFAEGGGKPILIEVKGYSFETMARVISDVQKRLAGIPGVFNIQDDRGQNSPETKLKIDKRRAALYGISALDISLIAKAALDGVVPTQYREKGREYDIRVRLNQKDRNNIENLNNMLLYSRVIDALLPLKEVATIERSLGPSEIKRVNQERTVIISAEIDKTVQSKTVLSQVQELLGGLELKPEEGIQVALSGKAKEVKENFTRVMFAFGLALLLNYMIMASQFESFLQPLIIMLTVPLALFGVSVALFISGHSMNVISLLGMIILAGSCVNNGIVLIEYINQAREEGKDVEEAALEASKVRTRPILTSATSSAMGLMPLALGLGEGAELRSPMAVAMMGGIISSTFLTLVVIPSMYILITRFTQRFMGEEDEDEDDEISIQSDEEKEGGVQGLEPSA